MSICLHRHYITLQMIVISKPLLQNRIKLRMLEILLYPGFLCAQFLEMAHKYSDQFSTNANFTKINPSCFAASSKVVSFKSNFRRCFVVINLVLECAASVKNTLLGCKDIQITYFNLF